MGTVLRRSTGSTTRTSTALIGRPTDAAWSCALSALGWVVMAGEASVWA